MIFISVVVFSKLEERWTAIPTTFITTADLRRDPPLPLWSMPTVLRAGPYRFHFYSREFNEPPHIHVSRDESEAKFWFRPVSLAANVGFKKAEVKILRRLVESYCQELIAAYLEFHEN